jgi:hypothetical protein
MKKPLAIASSGTGKGLRGRDNGGDLTNVQYKPVLNCQYESPPPYPNKKFIIEKKRYTGNMR